MSKRSIKLYLEDIQNSIRLIKKYTRGLDVNSFGKDTKTVDAVVRNLEIIGEAIVYISKEKRKEYPRIPWQQIIGMRNKIIHEYFGVDQEVLWQTIQEDIPQLKKEIKNIKI